MTFLYIFTGLAVIISLIFDRKKTVLAIQNAIKKMGKILVPLLLILIFTSLALYFIPEKIISQSLTNNNKYINTFIAALIGSITMMPGFIAFPLAGILRDRAVTYMVISAFTTTLMMVGILTFPLEKKYFGTKVALQRNLIGFGIALIVALMTGLLFGEL